MVDAWPLSPAPSNRMFCMVHFVTGFIPVGQLSGRRFIGQADKVQANALLQVFLDPHNMATVPTSGLSGSEAHVFRS